jgi:TATA-binding protein-associated factor Taf7
MEVMETKEPREATEPDEEEDDDEEDEDEEDEDEEDEERDEAESEEELLLARFFDRLAGGLATCTGSTPAAVNRNLLPSRSS